MQRWALACLVMALGTLIFGFLDVAAVVADAAKLLFTLSVLLLISFLAGPLIRPPKY